MSARKIFVHICCAPCFIAPFYQMKDDGFDVTGFWYNHNIHPYTEYIKRKETLHNFSERQNIPMVWKDEYALEEFIQNTAETIEARCGYCYESRLLETVKAALANGFDLFTTTLLYSRYQKHDLIREIAEYLAKAYHLEFYYQDWRQLWLKGIELSKASGMYRQRYCGCIYSEKDRYLGKAK